MRRLEHVMEQEIALKVNAVTHMYMLVSINDVQSVTKALLSRANDIPAIGCCLDRHQRPVGGHLLGDRVNGRSELSCLQ